MKFRTTFVLLILAAVAAALVFYTRQHGNLAPAPDQSANGTAEHPTKVFPFNSGQIMTISVKPAVGKPFSFARQGFGWRMTAPVTGPADPMKVNDLADAIANLTSAGQVTGAEVASTGIDPPRYMVEIVDRDGKTSTLSIGDRTGVGGGDYVKLAGQDAVQITTTSTPDLLETLSKPINSYRQAKLLELAAPDVHAIQIVRGKTTLDLTRTGTAWQITAPVQVAAEETAVSDLIFALTGLTATGFKGENANDAVAGVGPDAPFYRLDKPMLMVTLVSQAPATEPTTRPTTRPDITTTVRFGAYTNVSQSDVYAAVSGSPTVVTVPASILESFNKTPLDLRDLKVTSVDPANVESFSVQSLPSPSGPGGTTTIERVKPPAPKPGKNGTTAPATQPTAKWVIAAKKGTAQKAADDTRVDQLLASFNPLRAARYLQPTKWPTAPTTQPGSGRYIVHFVLAPPSAVLVNAPKFVQSSEIRILDSGPDQPIKAQYNDLEFELPRDVLEQIKSDLSLGAKPPTQGADVPDLTPSPLSR